MTYDPSLSARLHHIKIGTSFTQVDHGLCCLASVLCALLLRYIKDLQALRDSQHSRWSELAANTLQEHQRLEMAKSLMSRLGIDATARGPSEHEA